MIEQQQIDLVVNPTTERSEGAEPVIVRRVIDPKNGGGVQVYEGTGATKEEALEALADKMADAALHGTRKIREQAQEIKDWRSKNERAALTNDAASKFVSEHPDYLNDGELGDKNGELMRMKLAELGLSATPENLNTAYLHLKQRGFLHLKSEEAQPQPTTGKTREPVEWITQQPRVEPTRTQSRRTSTIGTHNRTWHMPTGNEFSEYDLERMPMGKLRELADKQLRERNN